MPNEPDKSRRTTALAIGAALALLTLLVYAPSFRFPLVNCDDKAYVEENPQVQAGLTWDSIHWAFTTFAGANWHPLTWLSLELDTSSMADGRRADFTRPTCSCTRRTQCCFFGSLSK